MINDSEGHLIATYPTMTENRMKENKTVRTMFAKEIKQS